MSLEQLIGFMTTKPAESFSLPFGTIEVGAPADIVLVNLEEERVIDPQEFHSKGKNTPFTGWNCKGWPEMTIASGEVVWEKGRVTV
jgi:dihydroorotase